MKTTKMSLNNIQGKLNRTEMKKIMAGSEAPCRTIGSPCNVQQHIICCPALVCVDFRCRYGIN